MCEGGIIRLLVVYIFAFFFVDVSLALRDQPVPAGRAEQCGLLFEMVGIQGQRSGGKLTADEREVAKRWVEVIDRLMNDTDATLARNGGRALDVTSEGYDVGAGKPVFLSQVHQDGLLKALDEAFTAIWKNPGANSPNGFYTSPLAASNKGHQEDHADQWAAFSEGDAKLLGVDPRHLLLAKNAHDGGKNWLSEMLSRYIDDEVGNYVDRTIENEQARPGFKFILSKVMAHDHHTIGGVMPYVVDRVVDKYIAEGCGGTDCRFLTKTGEGEGTQLDSTQVEKLKDTLKRRLLSQLIHVVRGHNSVPSVDHGLSLEERKAAYSRLFGRQLSDRDVHFLANGFYPSLYGVFANALGVGNRYPESMKGIGDVVMMDDRLLGPGTFDKFWDQEAGKGGFNVDSLSRVLFSSEETPFVPSTISMVAAAAVKLQGEGHNVHPTRNPRYQYATEVGKRLKNWVDQISEMNSKTRRDAMLKEGKLPGGLTKDRVERDGVLFHDTSESRTHTKRDAWYFVFQKSNNAGVGLYKWNKSKARWEETSYGSIIPHQWELSDELKAAPAKGAAMIARLVKMNHHRFAAIPKASEFRPPSRLQRGLRWLNERRPRLPSLRRSRTSATP